MGQADMFDHLRLEPSGLCWWCQARPATTGEHKFKRSDLARLMGDDYLIWGDREGNLKEIRGKSGITRDRHGVVKFPKSLCDQCNNARSQPFDRAYDAYAEYLNKYWVRVSPGVSFVEVFGIDWQEPTLDLARYYAKHFGCRMVRSGLPVPDSLRDFMDGGNDMPDGHMALVTTDSVHREYGKGLSISPDAVWADKGLTRFTAYVLVAYVGSIGVRYQWNEDGIPDDDRSQFFHFPVPVLNCFVDETAVAYGQTRRPGWFARLSQWINKPRE